MKNLNIVEVSENGLEVLARGNEQDLIKTWKNEGDNWIGWISEQEPEKYDEVCKTEIKNISDLKELFENELDYSWYQIVIVSDEELEEMK